MSYGYESAINQFRCKKSICGLQRKFAKKSQKKQPMKKRQQHSQNDLHQFCHLKVASKTKTHFYNVLLNSFFLNSNIIICVNSAKIALVNYCNSYCVYDFEQMNAYVLLLPLLYCHNVKVGRIASSEVIVQLTKSKCFPATYYALEVLRVSQFKSIN